MLRTSLGIFCVLIAVETVPAGAATSTTLFRADTLIARDTHLLAASANQRFGTSADLVVRDTKGSARGNALVDFNLTGLSGRTILQAWLRLRQYDATKNKPSTIRVHPVTQTWSEAEATWNERSAGVPWATPGGSFSPFWSDRVLAYTATSGTTLSWQVGPILAAYATGAFGLSGGGGFLLRAIDSPPDREIRFRSSEYADTTVTPLLEVVSTDEPPAVTTAWAEVKPNRVAEFQSTVLTLHLETDLSGATPSGTPTGYDLIRIAHGGAILVTGIDGVTLGGVPLGPGSASFTNDASGSTVQLAAPVTTGGRLTLRILATVQVGIAAREFALPVFVRRSGTGAGFQAAWPANADGIAGNGDHWLVTVFATSTSIRVLSVDGPSGVLPGENDVPFAMRVRNSGSQSVSIDFPGLTFTRSTPDDAGSDFTVTPDPANPDSLSPGAERVLALGVDVAPGAAPGPVTVDGQLIVIDLATGIAYADLDADTTQVVTVAAGGTMVSARQASRSVLPGESGVEILSFSAWNPALAPIQLQDFVLANATSGPGDQSDLDGEVGSLSLYADDGDGVFDPGVDLLLGIASMNGGIASWTALGAGIAAQDSLRFFVSADLALAARDGDILDVLLPANAFTFTPDEPVATLLPLSPAGGFPVDGMAAAQLLVHPVPARSLIPGSRRELVLDLTLPANGYQPDLLQRLNVENLGSAQPGPDIERLEAWRDQGSAGFDAAQDRLLGALTFTGDRWELTGLSEGIPVSGARVFVTADIHPAAGRPATIRLGIPSGEDNGIGMASRNSGPLDAGVANPEAQLITARDRVTLYAEPMAQGSAHPGEADVVLLDLILSNTYTSGRTLTELTADNLGSGPGTRSELDGDVRVLSLRWDANRNGILEDVSTDPLLGTASFVDGEVRFGGFDVLLAPDTAERLYLTAEVSLGAADGDVLSAAILESLDLGFLEPVAVAASWPVTSQGAWAVDGVVADQIPVRGAPAETFGPGDGPVLAFDFLLPGNGYLPDVLNGLRVENLGSAAAGDLAELRLWRDGGNGTFDSGAGDDTDLGLLIPTGGGWQSLSMSSALPASGARLFVALTVAPTFTGARYLELALPVDGVLVASGNDGPVDRALPSARRIELSDAPLLARLAVTPSPSTTGQSVLVTMTVENRGAETVNGIAPSALAQIGTGSLGSGTGPAPAAQSLAPGAVGSFTWILPAAAPGQVTLSASAQGTGAVSGLLRSSGPVSSAPHRIFLEAEELRVSTLEFMPYSVTIGQGGIVPLNLTFTNPAGFETSDIALLGLRIRLEDGTGSGIVPSALLTRVLVSEGRTLFADKTAIETTGSTVDLVLGAPYFPATISPGNPVTLSLQLHLAGNTTVTQFRVVIEDASWFRAEDAVSRIPVPILLESGSFPIRTGLANVVSEAALVEVRAADPSTLTAGPGQAGVEVLALTLENLPGSGAASSVRVGSLALLFTDESGSPHPAPGDVFPSLAVEVGGQDATGVDLSAATDSVIVLFSPPLSLAAGAPVNVRFSGQVAADAVPGSIRARLGASLDARDVNTGNPVPSTYAPSPLLGDLIRVEGRAEVLRVGGQAGFPSTVAVGEKDLTAIEAVLEHPGPPGTAGIRVDSLAVAVRDDRGQLLAPGSILDRVSVVVDGQPAVAVGALPSVPALVRLPLAGITLAAGETTPFAIVVDVDAGAPAVRFQLTLHGDDLHAADANLNTAVSVGPLPGTTLPLASGLTEILSPSRDLGVGLTSLLPAALVADGAEVPAGRVSFRNPAPDGSSAIRIRSLRLTASSRSGGTLALGAAASRVRIYRAGVLWAESALLAPDSAGAWVAFPADLSLLPGKTEILDLRVVTSLVATAESFRLGFDRADVGVVQPGGALLTVTVRPEAGRSFPLWTEAGTFGARTLRGSYANFPNPFAAGRDETAFVYYLPDDGRVTLRIWTLRGEEVVVLLDEAVRPAGLHQDDRWNGRNRTGSTVTNGVYVAELIVRFDGGSEERLLRKVAVVR